MDCTVKEEVGLPVMNQTRDEGDFQAMLVLHHKVGDLFQDHWVKLCDLSGGNYRHHL